MSRVCTADGTLSSGSNISVIVVLHEHGDVRPPKTFRECGYGTYSIFYVYDTYIHTYIPPLHPLLLFNEQNLPSSLERRKNNTK